MTAAALPDDPYHALGLSKDATAAAIKTAYRKLVLKHHPDKVQDESLKTTAADLFHKVQAAWETIGDEEKRSRYDAQARLAALRKEAMDSPRTTSRDMRSAQAAQPSYRDEPRSYDTRDSPRATSYRTEEVRPFDADYFDKSRREFDLPERSRPSTARDDRRGKPVRQDSKETERVRRQERTKQSTKATTRERDYKYAQAGAESESDSDHYRHSPRERDSQRYYEQTRKQHEEASSRFYDERTHQKSADAREYMERLTRRRPSPTRTPSRDQEYVRDADGRPIAFRRGSGRPKHAARDDSDLRPRRREMDRSSSELEDPSRRPVPPSLAQTKSAPHEIRLPYEKTRAASVQHSRAEMADFAPSPVKRADSMPLQPQARGKPVRQSTLRQTQTSDDIDRRRPAGRSKEYLDDYEVPTPDGYVLGSRRSKVRTQSPENYGRQGGRSPESYRPGRTGSRDQVPRRDSSPEPERSSRGADRAAYSRREPSVEANYSRSSRAQSPGYRPSHARYASQTTPVLPPLNTRMSSTTYTVSPTGVEQLSSTRPKLARGDSSRKDSHLFGEVPRDAYSPSMPEHVRYREYRPEIKSATGYGTSSRRPSEVRPTGYTRGTSFQQAATPPMSA